MLAKRAYDIWDLYESLLEFRGDVASIGGNPGAITVPNFLKHCKKNCLQVEFFKNQQNSIVDFAERKLTNVFFPYYYYYFQKIRKMYMEQVSEHHYHSMQLNGKRKSFNHMILKLIN